MIEARIVLLGGLPRLSSTNRATSSRGCHSRGRGHEAFAIAIDTWHVWCSAAFESYVLGWAHREHRNNNNIHC